MPQCTPTQHKSKGKKCHDDLLHHFSKKDYYYKGLQLTSSGENVHTVCGNVN
jgi:hypothetical protein